MDRAWTFLSNTMIPPSTPPRFLLVSIGGFLLNLAVLEILVSMWGYAAVAAEATAVAVSCRRTSLRIGSGPFSHEGWPRHDSRGESRTKASQRPHKRGEAINVTIWKLSNVAILGAPAGNVTATDSGNEASRPNG